MASVSVRSEDAGLHGEHRRVERRAALPIARDDDRYSVAGSLKGQLKIHLLGIIAVGDCDNHPVPGG
jgi:hypothetical protein